MPESVIALIVLAAAVLLFIWDRLPIAAVALLVPMALWMTGVLDLGEAVAGFGDPTVLFIAALFVVSEALDAAGVTAAVGGFAMRLGGTNPGRLLVTVMAMVAVLTALITPNGSVAALTPVIVVIAIRARRSPSELLLPAAFAAHSGSLLMLIGSPVTVVVADYAESTGAGRLGLFSTALIGLALTAATVGVVLLLGSRLVPRRSSGTMLRDLGEHGPLLAGHYGIEGSGTDLMQRGRGIAEFIVPPRSRFVGDRVHRGMVTESGDLVVVAMQHKGQTVTGPWRLKAGDSLLLQGSWEALNNAAADPDIVAVDDPDAVRRQAVPLGTGAKRALSVLAVMIVLLATGLVPAAVAGLLAALAMVLLRVIRVEQAYAGISWTTIILVGGMMSLSEAMVRSGAAQLLAEGLVSLVGGAGPYALLAGLFVITAVLGQLISNMATALIVIPIGVSAAAQMQISAMPVLVAIAVFAAAALLTPVATPANLMVQEAAGYRFGDYWRLGLPLLVIYGLAGVFAVPMLWPF
ncbi:SLC13 family permease [Micropruina sp.]|uniref:SLC13 family permease n=1 Tax=Micropruina sp. TaxID=2737536 RepID=UPI002628AF82|nr:SLC13 family permease [Micropruina sp.]